MPLWFLPPFIAILILGLLEQDRPWCSGNAAGHHSAVWEGWDRKARAPLKSGLHSSTADLAAPRPLCIWTTDQGEQLLIQPYLGWKSCQDTNCLKITGRILLEIVQSIHRASWLGSKPFLPSAYGSLSMACFVLVHPRCTKYLFHCLSAFGKIALGNFPELLLLPSTRLLYKRVNVLLRVFIPQEP